MNRQEIEFAMRQTLGLSVYHAVAVAGWIEKYLKDQPALPGGSPEEIRCNKLFEEIQNCWCLMPPPQHEARMREAIKRFEKEVKESLCASSFQVKQWPCKHITPYLGIPQKRYYYVALGFPDVEDDVMFCKFCGARRPA